LLLVTKRTCSRKPIIVRSDPEDLQRAGRAIPPLTTALVSSTTSVSLACSAASRGLKQAEEREQLDGLTDLSWTRSATGNEISERWREGGCDRVRVESLASAPVPIVR
jgi:hypothetical protein